MRAFGGGGFGHFRRLMRAFGGCFGRVLSSLSADKPVSHALSIVELSSQPVALKLLELSSVHPKSVRKSLQCTVVQLFSGAV